MKQTSTNILLLFLFLFLLLSVTFLVTTSFLSFHEIKPIVDGLSPNGYVKSFTNEYFNGLIFRLKVFLISLTIFLLFTLSLFYIYRRKIDLIWKSFISKLISDFCQINITITDYCKNNYWFIFALLCLMMIAGFTRWHFLFQPIRYDEALSLLYFATQPIYYVISRYDFPNNHIFHSILLHFINGWFGDEVWLIRLPAFISGILLVPSCYFFGLTFYDKYVALLSASFVASSSLLVEYSTNARGYMLICLFFVNMLTLAGYLKNHKNTFAWILLTAFSVLGFYTIPVMLYSYGIVNAWLLISAITDDNCDDNKYILKNLCIVNIFVFIVTLLLYSPIYIVSGVDKLIDNEYIQPKELKHFFSEIIISSIQTFKLWNRDVPIALVGAFIIGCFLSVFYSKRIALFRVPLVFVIIPCVLGMLVVQRVVPFTRVWLFLIPVYFILASSGIMFLIKKLYKHKNYDIIFLIGVLLLAVTLSCKLISNQSILYSKDTGTLKDAEKIAVYLKDNYRPGDAFLASCPSDYPIYYYCKKYGVPLNIQSFMNYSVERVFLIVNTSWKQTIESVLLENKVRLIDCDNLKILKVYDTAIVYEVLRWGKCTNVDP